MLGEAGAAVGGNTAYIADDGRGRRSARGNPRLALLSDLGQLAQYAGPPVICRDDLQSCRRLCDMIFFNLGDVGLGSFKDEGVLGRVSSIRIAEGAQSLPEDREEEVVREERVTTASKRIADHR